MHTAWQINSYYPVTSGYRCTIVFMSSSRAAMSASGAVCMKQIYSRKVAFSVISAFPGKEQRQIGMYERPDRLSDPANRE
jgi:hypothetical protein